MLVAELVLTTKRTEGNNLTGHRFVSDWIRQYKKWAMKVHKLFGNFLQNNILYKEIDKFVFLALKLVVL